MSKNDENQPLLDKDDAKTDYSADGEAAGGKKCSNYSNKQWAQLWFCQINFPFDDKHKENFTHIH